MRFLLVDDEEALTDMLTEALEEQFECDIDVVNNGLDAFICCQTQKYDMILADHEMPIMKGSALIIGIRTRPNKNTNSPILMITGQSTEGLAAMPELANVIFVPKPFAVKELFDEISKVLEK